MMKDVCPRHNVVAYFVFSRNIHNNSVYNRLKGGSFEVSDIVEQEDGVVNLSVTTKIEKRGICSRTREMWGLT
jgi:hypothetical protein